MWFRSLLFQIILISVISCREISFNPKTEGKKLFLSRRVVTETEEFDGGVLVDEDGKIEGVFTRQTLRELRLDIGNVEVIDGGDLALMAGMIDSHVHLNEPGRTSWEGFATGTRAAAAGGFTTLIDMPLNSIPPTTTLENLKVKALVAKEEIYTDVGFWGGVVPGNEAKLRDMIKAGVVGFKCFLIESGVSEFPYITADELPKVFQVLNGTGTVLAFHAELEIRNNTGSCTDECSDPLLYDTYLASRPPEMEIAAVSLISSLISDNDVHVHVVHVSAAGVVPILEAAREARARAGHTGWRHGVTAETCHHYLTLSAEQIAPGHTEYKCSPPVRDISNKLKLWDYIRDERLDLVASDHSPSTENVKGPNFMEAWGGISSVQFGLSLFWTEASARGYNLSTVSHYLSGGPARLTGLQERKGALRAGLDADLIFFDPNASFVVTPDIILYKNKVSAVSTVSAVSHYLSGGPARLTGLYERKGALRAGLDADLIFFDPNASFVVTPDIILYKNKISPYMYRVLRGKVAKTYLRGQLIYSDGEVFENPQGKLLLNEGFY
ncbi:amidohydrolase family domain-containing protein [Phthorimaea operculella]|nr:amidohydrolase family domain-containing protein [Phthorimaea operculella]